MKRIAFMLALLLVALPAARADQWYQTDEAVWAKRDTTFKRTKKYVRIYIRSQGVDDAKVLFDCQKKRKKLYVKNARKKWVVDGDWKDVTTDTKDWTLLRFACYDEYIGNR